MMTNYFIHAPKIIFDFLFDIIYFLPWWYSKGLKQAIRKAWSFIIRKEDELAVLVWLKNIHKPLTDNYNWKGILISILKRLGQIVFRSLVFLFWIIASAIGFLLYLIAPILIIWQIIFQIL